jgi:hypothetical protein
MSDERRTDHRDDDEGTPTCWVPDRLLRRPGEFDDDLFVLPRYESSWGNPRRGARRDGKPDSE